MSTLLYQLYEKLRAMVNQPQSVGISEKVEMKESKVDVLIIGAGPAGLMAGNALAKAGVSVRIVDKR